MNLSFNYNKLFVALYLSVILVPILGASDMMSTQMLYLQIVNIICFTFLIFRSERGELLGQLTKITAYYPVFIFFCFIIWASITIVKAVNLPESFRNLSDQFNYLTAFILLVYNLDQIKNKKNFIVNFFIIILTIEVFSILLLFLLDVSSSSFDFSLRKSSYKGLTGNINIAAFSIVIKLPLLIYKSISSSKRVYLYNLLLFTSGFVVVYLHKTRGAILTIALIAAAFLVFIVYQKIANKTFNKKVILPLVTIIFLFLVQSPLNTIFRTGESTFSRLQTINSVEDQSSAERKRYYKQAFFTMLENPVLGIGFGNWELESIRTDSENIRGYTVPYHAHNDLLELGAETGFIGTFLYFSILIIVVFRLLIKFISQKAEADPIYYFLVLCFGVYFCDTMLNFPFARPIQQMNYFSLLALSTLELKSKLKLSFLSKGRLIPFLKSILILLLILSPFVLYSSLRVYKAYTQHYFLLGYFNYNTYTADIDKILDFEDQYPDVISTTIPTQTLKGLFYTKQKEDFKSAIPYFKKGMKINPYLKLSESMLGFSYLMEDKIDSAIYHTENAFNKMPNNPIHFAHYVIALSAKKDIDKMKKAREKISTIDDETIDQIYLQAMANVLDKDNSKFILNSLDQKILKSDNDKLKKSYYILEFGKEIVLKAGVANKQAEEFFNNKEYLKAAQKFEEASRLNPLETPYMENAANAYMQAGEDQKALEIVDNILSIIDKNNIKMLYIKTLILLTREEYEEACEYLTILEKSKLKVPKAISNKYCN
jgi:O-antigen ligase/tetratricopeptide (TPR) repeat protein